MWRSSFPLSAAAPPPSSSTVVRQFFYSARQTRCFLGPGSSSSTFCHDFHSSCELPFLINISNRAKFKMEAPWSIFIASPALLHQLASFSDSQSLAHGVKSERIYSVRVIRNYDSCSAVPESVWTRLNNDNNKLLVIQQLLIIFISKTCF